MWLEKSKVFENSLEMEIFQKSAGKNRNFLKIFFEKLKFFKNLPGKIEIFCAIA